VETPGIPVNQAHQGKLALRDSQELKETWGLKAHQEI